MKTSFLKRSSFLRLCRLDQKECSGAAAKRTRFLFCGFDRQGKIILKVQNNRIPRVHLHSLRISLFANCVQAEKPNGNSNFQVTHRQSDRCFRALTAYGWCGDANKPKALKFQIPQI
jgi:hypothetical protein